MVKADINSCFLIVVIRWKVKEESTAVHEFFVKPHHSPETHPRKPNGRTLLVLNIPSFVSKVSFLYLLYSGTISFTQERELRVKVSNLNCLIFAAQYNQLVQQFR